MQLFSKLYARVMLWAAHRHAQWYLMGLSFAEASFFPVPPDVMLAPMSLANTHRAWRYATLATLASALGGVAGYLIGMFAFEMVQPWMDKMGYMGKYQMVVDWFDHWGVWVVFIAGFSPIPYKLFTIAAGVISMSFVPFLVASIVGRGARFFLVAGLMVWGGEKMDHLFRVYVDRVGWAVIALALIIFILIKYM
jgi:membrane protein YqaA with SNARE-associated domain